MSKTIKIQFRRDEANQFACLQYSWVPEGVRRLIRLGPGQAEMTQDDEVADDLHPSQVQVYLLKNSATEGLLKALENSQFPPGPAYRYPVDSAVVDVSHERMQIVGTVHYTDGTTASGTFPLGPNQDPCPQGPEGAKA